MGFLSNTIDGLVDAVAPERGVKRRFARATLKLLDTPNASYKGASRGRLRQSWNPSDASVDAEIEDDLEVLRNRVRQLNRDDGTAAGLTQGLVANVVGTGSNPQARVDHEALNISEEQADRLNDQIERAFERFAERADATDQLSFADCQALAFRQKVESGEFLAALEVVGGRLVVNMIEPDRMPVNFNRVSDAGENGIRMGVEVSRFGAPVAYHILDCHPGDLRFKGDRKPKRHLRYDGWRARILHGYRIERPGQTRGVPWAAPVLDLFKDFSEYLEAERIAARVAACFAIFIKKSNPMGAALSGADETQPDGKRLEGLEAGMIQYLGLDEEIQPFEPNRPGTTFDMFVMRLLRIIAAAFGLPYELVSMDFSRSNYSNMRAALLEARRIFKGHQLQMQNTFCQPIYERVIELAILRGEIDLPIEVFNANRAAVCRARWIHPGWNWVDPEKEVKAALAAIEGGLSSLGDEAASNGRDVEEVEDMRKREITRARSKGLVQPKELAESLERLSRAGYRLDSAQVSAAIGFDVKDAPATQPAAPQDPAGQKGEAA